MKNWIVAGCFFLFACGGKKEKKLSMTTTSPISQVHSVSDSNTAYSNNDTTITFKVSTPIKKPSGIYQFNFPYNKNTSIEQTIAFYNGMYRLQERYRIGKKDSVVITQGTWSPSDGYIWLYKDQVEAGRYTWKGDTLQYFSPHLNKTFSMRKLTPAIYNAMMLEKRSQDIFYGFGNEPLWSVELNNGDTLSFGLPDWEHPLKLKLASIDKAKDSTVYVAQGDSLRLRVTMLPYFCSDGMSDYIYSNKIQVQYNGKTYSGCGIKFK